MKIIDTYPDFTALFQEKAVCLENWRSYANGISPNLSAFLEHDAAHYDWEADILPVVTNALREKDKLAQAHSSFQAITQRLPQKSLAVFGAEPDVSILFYLGLCNGAGWAVSLDGKPAILLGAEKIVELGWSDQQKMAGLICHELGHLWHYSARRSPATPNDHRTQALWQLYAEGMAMHCEQLLCGDMDFYHQYDASWFNWCRSNQTRLFGEYKRRIDAQESVQPFFGDWHEFEGHSDVGYYLGAVLINKYAEKLCLQELANLDLEEIDQVLTDMAQAH